MTVAETTPKEEPKQEEPTGITVPKEGETPATEAPNGQQAPTATESKETKPAKTFTAEEVEKIRKEEKDKLYSRIESMDEELKRMREEREAREKAAKDAEKQAAAEAKKKAEEEMSAKELLAQKEQEWQAQFEQLRQERERDAAILERERQFSALAEYRAQRVSEEAENIMPELIDFVGGNTQEEIEASIERLKAKTDQIIGNVQQAQQQYRQQLPGTKVTAPPVGPVEQQVGYETLSADDIRSMDMETYKKRREQLLGAAARGRANKGLFG